MSDSESHRDRLDEIAFWAVPPKGSPRRALFENQIERLNRVPGHRQTIKKMQKRAFALFSVQQSNGAGLLIDRLVREYHGEYNSRLFNHSLHDMPGSFNVMEAFSKFLPHLAVFELREEKDHLFNFNDFLDYVTQDSFDSEHSNIKSLTEEGVVYSFNAFGDPFENKFSTRTDDEFSILGGSIIRFGDEISIMMLGGQHCDLAKESTALREVFASPRMLPHRTHIVPDQELEIRAEPISDKIQLWKTIFLTRFDLATGTVDARYVYQDAGRAYQGYTDDIACYVNSNGDFWSPELEDRFGRTAAKVDEFTPLLEVCKLFLYLPDFFNEHDDDVSMERHKTDFGKKRNTGKFRKLEKLVEVRHKLAARNVATIDLKDVSKPTSRSIATPGLVMQTSGYWKTLDIDEIGRDKNGNAIHGRTWVEKTLSWVAESTGAVTVNRPNAARQVGNDPGIIYVMRSAAHAKNIFKIGLTRRSSDARSSELSRTTSSPDVFLVVEEWEVTDCRLAESLCHEELDQYRVNPKREYFKAPYSTISGAIARIVSQVESDGRA
jgi:hypothetical protein